MEQSATATAEESLILWHQRYLAEDDNSIHTESDVVLDVESDHLDDSEMDRQVKQFMPTTDVAQRFCAKCRYLLEHWPGLPGEWECAVGKLLHTAQLTAAALHGCIFCAFTLSRLKDSGMLTALCKIETRLRRVGDGAKASISIQSWGRFALNWSQLLWVNFPVKVATDCNSHHARSSQWQSNTLLLSDTLTAFLRNIPIQDLPQTFKDAIAVTRRLGLEYVWVDALCIIQTQQVGRDEETDWEKEVGKMESVYGGAHVGLAASDASDVHGGMFRKPPHYNGGFSARLSSKDSSRIQCFFENNIYKNSSKNTHLAGRAWALQEKLLAARTISFGREGLFWECKSTVKSEYLPGGFNDRLGRYAVRPEHIAWDWSEIVQDYSSAALTVDSDRLPALAGIARRQHGITGDQYLVGMWRKRLETRLPWRCIGPPQQRPDWRAPTWSWTSINGRVEYPACWDDNTGPPRSTYISVLSVSTTPAGTDRFGAVAKGSLTLACSAIIDATIEDKEGEDKDSGQKAILLGTAMVPFTVNMDCLDDELGQMNAGLYLLSVSAGCSGHGRIVDGEFLEARYLDGIVLRECSNGKQQFSRVGSFHFQTDLPPSKEDVIWRERYDDLLRITEEEGLSIAESRCARILTETNESTAQYVITII
ncbi:tol protein [Apiospora sp. TS-2023a]